MKSIKIQNLRSIKNTEIIPLNALTVLLGQNSSGKSTFLRIFPLLKQSIEKKTSGPILWFGDYVDFGDFDVAVRKGEKEISFQFEIELPKNGHPEKFIQLGNETVFIINFSMRNNEKDKTYVKHLTITSSKNKINISYNSAGLITSFLKNNKNLIKLEDKLTYKSDMTSSKSGIIEMTSSLFIPEYNKENHGVMLLLSILDEYLAETIKNFHYIKPIRAIAERSYRKQDLSVTEIDPHGNNLFMFIENLSEKELKNFQKWTEKSFDFYPYTVKNGVNIEVRLVDTKTGNDFNVADRGFGFSQILPIVTQLWHIILKETSNNNEKTATTPIIFAIEQPELHLHPYLQSQLTDCFIETIKYAKEKGVELKLIIETHSQTIVNRIGHRIINEDFSENDVSIVLFEADEAEKNSTSVFVSKYNKQGFLENWPIGFFEPKEL